MTSTMYDAQSPRFSSVQRYTSVCGVEYDAYVMCGDGYEGLAFDTGDFDTKISDLRHEFGKPDKDTFERELWWCDYDDCDYVEDEMCTVICKFQDPETGKDCVTYAACRADTDHEADLLADSIEEWWSKGCPGDSMVVGVPLKLVQCKEHEVCGFYYKNYDMYYPYMPRWGYEGIDMGYSFT